MRLQDYFQYDKTIVGLNNLYVIDYKGDFYINSPCIMATDKTISTGRIYLLVDNPTGAGVSMTDVNLIDVYYDEGVINLNVQEINFQKTLCLNQYIKCPQNTCKWVLIDLDYLNDEINAKAIQSYCGKYADTKKKSGAKSNPKILSDDLLDFEF
ncbi:MAG: hypothetical protein ABR927_16730 [Bacteroidales bacterium]|jgi:hypothetical protein